MAKVSTDRLAGFTYAPRGGTESARMVALIRSNLDMPREDLVGVCVKAGFQESKARSWLNGFIGNGSVPGRLPNGALNVPNDKAKNKELAKLPVVAETKPAKAKKAPKAK